MSGKVKIMKNAQGEYEPNWVDIITELRGWERMKKDEKIVVHFVEEDGTGQKGYEIRRVS